MDATDPPAIKIKNINHFKKNPLPRPNKNGNNKNTPINGNKYIVLVLYAPYAKKPAPAIFKVSVIVSREIFLRLSSVAIEHDIKIKDGKSLKGYKIIPGNSKSTMQGAINLRKTVVTPPNILI